MPEQPRILRLPAVIARTGLSRTTIYRFMDEGTFPRPVPIGARAVGWSSDAVDAWIADKLAAASAM